MNYVFTYLFIQTRTRIPPGRVMRRRLLLKCHSMMRICCPSMIWGHVGAIFKMYQEDLGATWVYVGVRLSHARAILALSWHCWSIYLVFLLIKPMVFA